ncbi:MAG TPA: PfkB family carbohydrate kinase [Solirubrobacteraceae bacterium]
MSARYDYVTVGHVTLDLIEDRPRDHAAQPGGGAFYSALQAARLGLRTLIVTQGVPGEIEELLAPYAGELDLRVIPARHTTTFATTGSGTTRAQRVLSWAGPIVEPIELDSSIVHLAAVARETPTAWRGTADFVALTPQGLLREWQPGEATSLVALSPAAIPSRFDAAVIGEREHHYCDALFEGARGNEAPIAVTAGPEPTTVYLGGEESVMQAAVPATATVSDDLGAGDVFAAAFFVSLLDGMTAADAATFGNAAATFRVMGVGAEAVGTRAQILTL